MRVLHVSLLLENFKPMLNTRRNFEHHIKKQQQQQQQQKQQQQQ